jgi:hypothetical protein
MTAVKTRLNDPSGSRPVQPTAEVPRSALDLALDYIGENMGGGGGGSGAPDDAEYLVASSDSGLSNERVATNTTTIEWDFSTTGQAKANVAGVLADIAAMSDPGADRLFVWDDSASAYAYFTAGTGLGFVGTNFSITDTELVAIAALTAAADKGIYFTSASAAATFDLTSFARTLLDDASATAARATLGVDTLGGIDDVNLTGLDANDVLYWTGAEWRPSTASALAVLSSLSDVSTAGIADGDILVYDAATQTWVAEQNTGGSATGAPVNAGYYVTTASGTLTNETVVPAFIQTLLDDTSASDARTTLGLVIGTDVQAWDAALDDISGLAVTDGNIIVGDGANWVAESGATARASLGLTIGTHVQAYDALLASIAGLTFGADNFIYGTGSDTAAAGTITAFGRSIVDDADEATFKATVNLEIGTDVQAWDAGLDAIAGLAVTDGNIIVGDGATWVAESGATARTSLGLAIGTNVQAWDAALDDISGLAVTDGNIIVGDGANWVAESGATARASLGLTIGTHVQAYDAELAAIAGLTSAADRLPYFTGSETAALATFTAFARSILDDADEATFKATVNLEIGVDVQAYDAELAAIAGLTSAADKLPYFTGSGTADLADLTSFARTLLDDANAAAALATLGAMGQGKHTIWIPAGAMKKRSTGPSTGSFSAGSTEFDYWAFDASTAEDVTFTIAMPKSWNEGSVSYQIYWGHGATATNFGVVWTGFVKAYSNDDAIDGASYTTIGSVTDTGGTTSDLYIADESASTAVGSAAENDLLNFIIRREATNGSDTLAVDAYLVGVKIFYTTNAATDA